MYDNRNTFSLSPVLTHAWKIHGSILQENFTHNISLPFSWSMIIWFVCQWDLAALVYFQYQDDSVDFYTCSSVILIRSGNFYQGSVGNFNKVQKSGLPIQVLSGQIGTESCLQSSEQQQDDGMASWGTRGMKNHIGCPAGMLETSPVWDLGRFSIEFPPSPNLDCKLPFNC